ncbi:hydroxymethylpyrimidine/phosphomethylpyrimidine kinase [Herminiimonas sp.]|uniref:bifunctional hydroxymethylpyrimidine kinase/phosphomethylpyrimidine kinase n=1 Tax=Herminiimonas sp. TaxID=1926289 RepID=UPI002728370F|nr:hydroxymethylpyrimidine/phosphomethylpyrimidine kinase [Herminiimonas sp.]MDO8304628.1 hydroxymethylpyrimidine/phosphomethylpyrimidine kinase [Herminiimonas sp.]
MQNQTPPLVLTFGAADPVGAAGIQADLACFAAMGCHGLSVITAILISDTTGIEDVQNVDADWVADQARVLLEDMQVAAFKVGYAGNTESIAAIAEVMSDYPDIPLVLDPFATSMPESGEDAEEMLIATRELLVPQATLLLLSAVELGRFAETWREAAPDRTLADDAADLIRQGCQYVFVTGMPGEMQEVSNTLFSEEGAIRQDSWQRQPGSFAGAGSTLSATIAALLANGLDVPEAVAEAQEFNVASLAHAQRLGMGKLIPDRHFWARESDDNP